VKAIRDGRSKALICLGGNLAVAMSDPDVTYPAMRSLDLVVHIATKLNRSHLSDREGVDHPAMPWPHRDRRAGDGSAIGHGGRFDVDGARLARRLEAGLGASEIRDGDRRRYGHRDAAESPR
jgi:hypothetical protein